RRAMAMLETTPDTTAIIGDQLFTDIWGGKRLGLYTILVSPLSPRESLFTRALQRPLERAVGRKTL
ncbi:MAG TPA: HAD hydrolase-like protein, partial [Armatimonadota bacterium]|nr:HAD hydrolase-like protein [Armatimonadota bacterium]